MKNVTDKKVISAWARPVSGLEAQSKHMRCKDDILYYDGQPVARHYKGIVLVSAWSEDGHRQFDPGFISRQIGLPLDEVVRLRQKVLETSLEEPTFWWCLPPNYANFVNAIESQSGTCYVVSNCLESPSQRTIESAKSQIAQRLAKAMRCRSNWSIDNLLKRPEKHDGYRYHWLDLTADNILQKTKKLAQLFSLDASPLDSLKPLFDECQSRVELFSNGGPQRIGGFAKDHQLSKHTPIEVIVELMKRPEFHRGYDGEYTQDLMIRQMAASEVRAKYGAKGDRKKKVGNG